MTQLSSLQQRQILIIKGKRPILEEKSMRKWALIGAVFLFSACSSLSYMESKALDKPIGWSAPHIQSGKKWREVVKSLPEDKAETKAS